MFVDAKETANEQRERLLSVLLARAEYLYAVGQNEDLHYPLRAAGIDKGEVDLWQLFYNQTVASFWQIAKFIEETTDHE